MSPGFMTERSKPVVKINDLPDEVLLEIFSHLLLDDMARSALVCKRWHYMLKGEKELWRRKEWTSSSEDVVQRFLTFGASIPRLRSLWLVFDRIYGIRVAWPDVTLYLHLGNPVRWESYFRSFDTESLVVSSLVTERISSYVQCTDTRTLRRICIIEQGPMFLCLPVRPYFTSGPTSLNDSCPVRRRARCELSHSVERCYGRDDPLTGGELRERATTVSEPDAYACPALEVVNVHCRMLSDAQLYELCALGPMRVLRIERRGLGDLLALRGLGSHLEKLYIGDCAEMKPWDYRELRRFVGLRTLRLGQCRLEEAALRDLTAGLPHLRKLSLNGRELLARSH